MSTEYPPTRTDQTARRYLGPGCTCESEIQQPNAGRFDPYFPGIRRNTVAVITTYDPKCPNHGHIFTSTLAAELRYGD